MIKTLKLTATLAALFAIGIVAYAYLGDLSPNQVEITAPVALHED